MAPQVFEHDASAIRDAEQVDLLVAERLPGTAWRSATADRGRVRASDRCPSQGGRGIGERPVVGQLVEVLAGAP